MAKPSTRAQIAEKADTLFYEGGFEATSFADIAGAVGISRGNFYYHFRTKDEILDAVITRRLKATEAMLETWQVDVSPQRRILSFIRILITNRAKIMAFGCPVGTLNTELSKLNHVAQTRAAAIFGLFREWLAAQFTLLGHVKAADRLALHLLGRTQGVAVMASSLRDESFLRAEVALMEDWLRGLQNPASYRQAGK